MTVPYVVLRLDGDIGIAKVFIFENFNKGVRDGRNQAFFECSFCHNKKLELFKICLVLTVSFSDLGSSGARCMVGGCTWMNWLGCWDSIIASSRNDESKVSMMSTTTCGRDGHCIGIELLMDNFEVSKSRFVFARDRGKFWMRKLFGWIDR